MEQETPQYRGDLVRTMASIALGILVVFVLVFVGVRVIRERIQEPEKPGVAREAPRPSPTVTPQSFPSVEGAKSQARVLPEAGFPFGAVSMVFFAGTGILGIVLRRRVK